MNTWRRHLVVVPTMVVILLLFLGPEILGPKETATILGFTIVAIFAYSWNIVGGIIGELNFALLVSWALGGYLVFYFVGDGWPLLVAVALGVVAGAGFNAILSLITSLLKLEGLILAVFTLVVVEVTIKIVNLLDVTGGPVGLRLRIDQRFTMEEYHLVGVVVLLAMVLLTHFLLLSRRGLRWLAIRDDDVAAASVGIHVRSERFIAALLAGGMGAVGGALQTHQLGFALPATALSIPFLVIAVLAVFAGGPGTLQGPMIGTVIIYGLGVVADDIIEGTDADVLVQLSQYLLAFLIVRWLIAKGSGDDLGTTLARTMMSWGRSSPEPEPDPQPGSQPTSKLERVIGPELLVLDGVTKSFGGLEVLKGVSFTVHSGEFVALVGPNGAGKSTVTNLVAGMLRPDAGEISFQGERLAGQSTAKMFQRGVARTFQIPRLMPRLTLMENVALGCDGERDLARESLLRVGVKNVDRKAAEATLFEHRMVEVARALVSRARLIILDEPLAGLSPGQRDEVLSAVQEHIDAETGVVIIEHLIPTISPVVDRMLVLVDGTILVDGPPAVVLNDPRVIESYLGKAVVLP